MDVSPRPPALAAHSQLFVCPACSGRLEFAVECFRCLSCESVFGVEAGIPLLFCPNNWARFRRDVTERVKTFYEACPFPNYDDLDSSRSLLEKAQRGIFAKLLDEQIPQRARVLEVGCGTGQLSNFLGLQWGRTVFGTDVCLNSLKLGQAFRKRNQIKTVAFVRMNLFRPVFPPESFDVVICNGVLHHTSDPWGGFQTIARMVKPGGVIIVGLYNACGRIPTQLRRCLYRLLGNRMWRLDSYLRDPSLSQVKKRAWEMDQYQHPHESTHTFDEVLEWFHRSGIEFLSSIPKAQAFEALTADEQLFAPHPPGSRLDHWLVQAGMLLAGGREGGLFVMIGRRASRSTPQVS